MKNNKQERVHTIGFSLVSKLNIQLWFRLIGTLLLLNLVFLSASVVFLFIHGEQQALKVVKHLQLEDTLDNVDAEYWRGQDIEILPAPNPKQGVTIPSFFQNVFPQETRYASRRVNWPKVDVSLYQLVDYLEYQLDFNFAGERIAIVIHFTTLLCFIKNIFIVLLFAQMLIAFRALLTRANLIRQVLKPISDLAERAQSLSQEKGPLSIQEMQVLAGTIDEINAASLDTRIDLDSTQDELKNLASAINSLLERMNESYRLQARFVSDASHELRTPIAAIQGYANLLDRWGKHDPDALQESIDALKEEAANMKDLVEQLLFLARGDNHTMHLDLEVFNLAELAQIIHRETAMIDAGHIFKIEVEESLIYADQALLKQAGRILIDNAIKYTPVGGVIKITVSRRKEQVHFAVQDSGIGIPPDDIPHIFERFYRADESRARATGGTGLGLSIAKWIAERHGGHLEVLSREEFGSRISLIIPDHLVS